MRHFKDPIVRCIPVVLTALLATSGGCIEDRSLDVVLTGDLAVDIHHDQNDVTREIPVVVGVPGALTDILADNGYALEDVEAVYIAGASYGTLSLEGDHDWVISGDVTVQRVDGLVAGPREPLLDYTALSVTEALGRRIVAPLNESGVTVLHDAMQDYIDGDSPLLELRIRNTDTTPQPTLLDPMVFDWKVWVELRIVLSVDARVPDPF